MYDANTVSYTVDKSEYCYNVNKPSIAPSSMQVHIPALMVDIPMGLPKSTPRSVPTNIFANDSACKPRASSIVNTQNYVTITKWKNERPSFPNKDDGLGRLVRYSKFLVDIHNGDIRNMHICSYI